MNDNLTEIVYLLDKSGSMNVIAKETIEGVNSFVKVQADLLNNVNINQIIKFSLMMFDTNYEVFADGVDIREFPELKKKDYFPAGYTAYYDALAKTIDNLGKRLSETPEEERPSKVMVIIMSDGEENSSIEFTGQQVYDKIMHQQEKYNWQFLFFGCNQDALQNSKSVGIKHASNVAFNSRGIGHMYDVMGEVVSNYSSTGIVMDSLILDNIE